METLTKVLSIGSTVLMFIALALFVAKYCVKVYRWIRQEIGRIKIERRKNREAAQDSERDRKKPL